MPPLAARSAVSHESATDTDVLPPLFAELAAWAGNDGSPQLRVLDSVAQFTHHRDIDALDHSLTLSLAELADAHVVTLYKRNGGRGDPCERLVRCTRNALGRYGVVLLPQAADAASQTLLRQS